MSEAKDKVLVGVDSGEAFGKLYIATDDKKWAQRLGAWQRTHWYPCPMPEGHLMFEHPMSYQRAPVTGHAIVDHEGVWKLPQEQARALVKEGLILTLPGYQDAEPFLYQYKEGCTKEEAQAWLAKQGLRQSELAL